MIAIIVYEFIKKYDLFLDAAKKNGVELIFIRYKDLDISFLNNEVIISYLNQNLSDFNAVYIKQAQNEPELSALVAEYLLNNNIPVIDKVFRKKEPWIDRKTFEYTKLAYNNLPIIDSVFIEKNNIVKIDKLIKYPCVVKESDGAQGKSVWLANNRQELETLFNKSDKKRLLVQRMIANDGDYRIFVIGKKIVAAIKRVKSDEKHFQNNISLGAKAHKYIPNTKQKQVAIKACEALSYDIAGVDLIMDGDEIKIIEVNRSPGYEGVMRATSIDIPMKIVQFIALKSTFSELS